MESPYIDLRQLFSELYHDLHSILFWREMVHNKELDSKFQTLHSKA